MRLRALRRDRAARLGSELFLLERVFEDCLERLSLIGRTFERVLLIGCPDARWPDRLKPFASRIDVRDPGKLFAQAAGGTVIIEDAWDPAQRAYGLVLAIGTLDTVNDLPMALRLIRYSMRDDGLLIGAVSGGETLSKLRSAMRAADSLSGAASPHIHPRLEASALSPLLMDAGFVNPVVDLERVKASYSSLERLVADLRAMGATNVLKGKPRSLNRRERASAAQAFSKSQVAGRTSETFELIHFAAWTAPRMTRR